MLGMKCKTKTNLVSVDECILGWPCSDRETEQLKSLAHSRHRRGQARLGQMRCVSSQEILLCQQRIACVKWTKAFNWLHIDQTAVIVNHVCKCCTENNHSDFYWCQCEWQWHFANNSIKLGSCQRTDWKPKVWHVTAHVSSTAISEGPNQLPWS